MNVQIKNALPSGPIDLLRVSAYINAIELATMASQANSGTSKLFGNLRVT